MAIALLRRPLAWMGKSFASKTWGETFVRDLQRIREGTGTGTGMVRRIWQFQNDVHLRKMVRRIW